MTFAAPLFDTHCHLDDKRFQADLAEVLERAEQVGVWKMALIGCVRSPENLRTAFDLAALHPSRMVSTIGVHPHDATTWTSDAKLTRAIEELAAQTQVVAIGEMGLDYFYDHSPRELQLKAFREQIAMAKNLRKPIVVHSRDAREDTLRVLEEERAFEVGGILHCFSEDLDFAQRAWSIGFVSSFSGIVTFKTAEAIQEAARLQPDEAILIETDAPYLAPLPHRGRRNEPSYVANTLNFLAKLRNVDSQTLAWQTTRNACRVFGIAEPASQSVAAGGKSLDENLS